MAKEKTLEKKAAKKKNHRSLSTGMLVLILGCWVLPMFITIGASGVISQNMRYERVVEVTKASVQNNMDIIKRGLEDVVGTSFNASYIPTVRKSYQKYKRDGDRVALYETLREFLRQDYERNSMTKGAFLLFPNKEEGLNDLYFAYNQALATAEDTAYYNRFDQSEAVAEAMERSEGLDTKVSFFIKENRLFLMRNLTIIDNHYRTYAIFIIELNQQALFESIIGQPELLNAEILINGEPVFILNNSPSEGEMHPTGERYQSREVLTLKETLAADHFNLAYDIKIDLRHLLANEGLSQYLVFILGLFALLLMGGVLFFFYRKVFRPINSLGALSREIEEGNFGLQIEADDLGSKEFAYLGGQMNAMSAKLENQFERIYKEELALRDARMKALQSQINPHFLGNTLEVINWEARLAGDRKVVAMLEALTTMLEAALDRDQRPFIPLGEELKYVEAYLYIISQRLGKRLTVEKEVDESLMDWQVPKLILQPIMENAVEHGVVAHQKGWIVLRIYATGDEWLAIEVENEAPMSKEDEEKVAKLLRGEETAPGESSYNIGIRNVHQRLRLAYGEHSGLTIRTNKKGHTVATMLISKGHILQ